MINKNKTNTLTQIMRNEIIDILEYLKNSNDITEYKFDNNIISIKTDHDKEDIDFLKFRILAACTVLDENLENILKIEIM